MTPETETREQSEFEAHIRQPEAAGQLSPQPPSSSATLARTRGVQEVGRRPTPRPSHDDGIHRCVHCETSGVDEAYTYCPNCGAVACDSHIKTERLEGEPVCTGCAVAERFALKKYSYDDQNLEAFREECADMPLHEKAMENKLPAGGGAVTVLLLLIGLLVNRRHHMNRLGIHADSAG